jgi:cysteinyl-tRNA synthetase
MADILHRTLEYLGYKVNHVMNVTDVDDKTIAGSTAAGQSLGEFTRHYEQIFRNGLASFNIVEPKIIRATDNIAAMVTLIEKLLAKNIAYKTSDGVYFKVSAYPNYGQFQRISSVESTEADGHDKADSRDFALWKFTTQADGPTGWDTSFGRGRPGWHIECSAMSMQELGETFDIHTGGIDLIFPHHENELAQSQASTSKPLAHFWFHNEFITVDGKKMSKSLGNVYLIDDLPQHHITPLAYRYWLLGGHYRSSLNFTWEAVTGAHTALEKLRRKLAELSAGGKIIAHYQDKFIASISDDLNTAQTLALMWELIASEENPADIKATILDWDKVLGLKLDQAPAAAEIPDQIKQLATERETARQNKDWAKADELRQEIEKQGYVVEDKQTGPEIKPN